MNPNLNTCFDCGHEVSRTAVSCPHCGAVFKAPRSVFSIVLAVLVSLFLIGVVSSVIFALLAIGLPDFLRARHEAQQNSQYTPPATPLKTTNDFGPIEKRSSPQYSDPAATAEAQRQFGDQLEKQAQKQRLDELVFLSRLKRANEGDGQSQVDVADCFSKGIGTSVDLDRARFWLSCAVTNGVAGAREKYLSLPVK